MSFKEAAKLARQNGASQGDLLLSEIAALVGGELVDGSDPLITGVAGLKEANPGDLSFLATRRYLPYLRTTRAAAVLIGPADATPLPAVRVENPALAFMKVVRHFSEKVKLSLPRTVHATAVLDDTVVLGRDVSIGAHVTIEGGVVIGDRTTILPGTCILRHSRLGSDCLVYPNVVLREYTEIGDRVILHAGAVLGSDGFGFMTDKNANHLKVPQIGRVVLEDDVEVGANSCIDRATTGVTRVRRGTKIDNLVQVAHNVEIGEDSLLCAQVGVSGSTLIGSRVKVAGQAGLAGHIRIGDGAVIGAQGGVTKSVPPDTCVSGYPARPHAVSMRQQAAVARLPEMLEALKALQQRVRELEGMLERPQ